MNLWTVFLTGLFTGGLSCMAVQGGLLTALILSHKKSQTESITDKTGSAFLIVVFLAAKIFAYTILGLFLGFFGSVFILSTTIKFILLFSASAFMLVSAFNLLDIHPVFRYFAIKPPKFLMRITKDQSRKKDFFAPFVLGVFTVFIPCGTTQAMMALALSTADPVYAASIMFVFTLATSPVFFLLGILAMKLTGKIESLFTKTAATLIIILAVLNFEYALNLSGSNFTLKTVFNDIRCTVLSICGSQNNPTRPDSIKNEHVINFSDSGYSPDAITVKTGSSVKLRLINSGASGCIQAFTIPKFNINKIVRNGTEQTIEFTAPDKPQDIKFTCSMGMYQGIIHVI